MENLFIIANLKNLGTIIKYNKMYQQEFIRNLIDESMNQLYFTYKTICFENS